jgi:hypothetical protein
MWDLSYGKKSRRRRSCMIESSQGVAISIAAAKIGMKAQTEISVAVDAGELTGAEWSCCHGASFLIISILPSETPGLRARRGAPT